MKKGQSLGVQFSFSVRGQKTFWTFGLALQEEIALAWDVIRTEPVIVRLHCSLTQYLNGPGQSKHTHTHIYV